MTLLGITVIFGPYTDLSICLSIYPPIYLYLSTQTLIVTIFYCSMWSGMQIELEFGARRWNISLCTHSILEMLPNADFSTAQRIASSNILAPQPAPSGSWSMQKKRDTQGYCLMKNWVEKNSYYVVYVKIILWAWVLPGIHTYLNILNHLW